MSRSEVSATLDAGPDEPAGDPADLRLLPSAAATWSISLLTSRWPVWASVLLAVVLASVATVMWRRRGSASLRRAVALALLVASVATLVTCAHVTSAWSGPVPGLAARAATVRGVVSVTADPVLRESTFGHGTDDSDGSYVVVHARLIQVTVEGAQVNVRTPVVLTGPTSWSRVTPGQRIGVIGRLAPTTRGDDVVAVLSVRSPPRVIGSPSLLMRAAQHLRDGLAASVRDLPADQRALVPALVDGDVSQFPTDLQQAFRLAGLTHLSAVSGTNLSILLALVLALGRPLRIRGTGALVLGLATVVFFVVLARPQPSVLRAAAMGSVVVLGSVFGFRRGGLRALAIAVTALLLVDPWLGRSAGFALSALATGGLVLLAPGLATAMSVWAPRPVAVALAVPLAAQLTTMPVIAAISASVSLVAIPANLLAEPAVGPATVLGVGLTVLAVLWPAAAGVAAWLPFVPAWWIAEVARVAAGAPGRAITFGDTTATGSGAPSSGETLSPLTLALVTLATLFLIVGAPRFLRSRRRTVLTGLIGVVVLVAPASVVLGPLAGIGTTLLGWPPADWRIVACDVGQGDALVLRAGPHAAVVVDTGPDPGPIRQCLDRLGVTAVPYVLLTHFHEDHVGGLAGVLAGRDVGVVGVTRSSDIPAPGVAALALATARHVPVVVARLGETWQVGYLGWQTLWPERGSVVEEVADRGSSEGSGENDASVVWRARVGDISVLMTGDVEPSAQATLLRRLGGALAVDVVKVPHHGSRYQDPGFLAATGARVALVSAGLGNDYGHPNPGTLELLTDDGARVLRTDLDGSSAVAGDSAHLRTVTQLARPRSVTTALTAVAPGPTGCLTSRPAGPLRATAVDRTAAARVMGVGDGTPVAVSSPRCRSPPSAIRSGPGQLPAGRPFRVVSRLRPGCGA
jgi:competence protein ComEC